MVPTRRTQTIRAHRFVGCTDRKSYRCMYVSISVSASIYLSICTSLSLYIYIHVRVVL